MQTIESISELRSTLSNHRSDSFQLGFVPTMGALHEGHLSLIRRSVKENDSTVVSIFVNPLQFDNVSDLESYPKVLEEDLSLIKECGVDYVFIPDEEEFYREKPLVSVNFGALASRLEGKFRKGHFEGVGIVVSKLLHLVDPDGVYFGLKDLQQYLLIKRMCADLSFRCEVIGVDTVRESSGLALSSRNRRLSDGGKEIAAVLSKALFQIEDDLLNGMSLPLALTKAQELCQITSGFDLEYLEAINTSDLSNVDNYEIGSELAVCIAGYVEGVRLIDNLYLRPK
ncbi:MAG: pantoate--beta-alanine ligase [Ekhidna sp.]|nr:pantoate--beta-alanine ligase [Ekhidna sp.]